MISKKLFFVFLLAILCALFTSGCNPTNRHSWILPNNEKIEYHEGSNEGAFTANIPEYISWTSEKRNTNSVALGYNGGFVSFKMNLNQNQTLAWLTGEYAGSNKQDYVAIFDLMNFKITDGDCMWESESNINLSDIKLKHEVEQSIATATAVEEKK